MLLGTFNEIVAYFVFVAVVFLGLTVAGTLRVNGLLKESTRLRVPGYPYTPMAFLFLVVGMLFLLASRSPVQAFLGVLVVLIGVPCFRLMQK